MGKKLQSALFRLFLSRASPIIVQYAGKTLQNAAVAAAAALAIHGIHASEPLLTIASGIAGLLAALVDMLRVNFGGQE